MPAILTHDCPYCGTRSVAFACMGKHYEGNTDTSNHIVSVLLACGNCNSAAMARLTFFTSNARDKLHVLERSDVSFSFAAEDFELVEFYPKASAGTAPDHTPTRVADLFRQASNNYHNRNWDASGAMSRKTLDVATKIIARERLDEGVAASVSSQWLKARLATLVKHNLLTPDVANLASFIKDSGDDATHDEDPYTEHEAAQLLRFSEVLLTYVFTIRGMVAAASP